ncbi:MAG: hypothetical protein IPK60_24690 [Sandaracinaceae bacterium]|nr:hypothetical protein [Sandaracinaceae bacterium]
MLRFVAALTALVCLAACKGDDIPSSATWPDGTHVVSGTGPLAYVTNNGSDTLSIVSLHDLSIVATVPVGLDIAEPEAPHHLAADPAHGYVYVGISNVKGAGPHSGIHGDHGGGDADSYVQRLHIEDLSPAGATRVDPNLGDIVLFGGTRLVTTHFDLKRATEAATMGLPPEEGWASLTLVDGTTMEKTGEVALCTAPHGVAVTSDGRLALAACYGDDRVAFVDVSGDVPQVLTRATLGPLANDVPPPHYGPYSVLLFPDESAAFVGNTDTRDLRVMDVATMTVRDPGVVPLSGAAFFGAFSPDGATFYVPTQVADTLSVVDVATLSVTQTIPMDPAACVSPHVAMLDPQGTRILLVCEGDHLLPGSLVVFERSTLDIVDVLPLGVYPDGIQIVNEVTW